MAKNKHRVDGRKTAWADQFDSIKETLDSLAYEVVQETEDADFYEKLKFGKILVKADVNYNTFISNQGYERLEMYNGVKNIENKKKINFNPYRWLRARNLSENNDYYISEVYE